MTVALLFLLGHLSNKLTKIIEQLDTRWETKSLHGSVRILHIRTNADSLNLVIRELVDDDTTLKTSMDRNKLGLSLEHVLEDSASSLAKTRIGLSGPSRAIGSVLDLLATIECRVCNHVVGKSMKSLVDG